MIGGDGITVRINHKDSYLFYDDILRDYLDKHSIDLRKFTGEIAISVVTNEVTHFYLRDEKIKAILGEEYKIPSKSESVFFIGFSKMDRRSLFKIYSMKTVDYIRGVEISTRNIFYNCEIIRITNHKLLHDE